MAWRVVVPLADSDAAASEGVSDAPPQQRAIFELALGPPPPDSDGDAGAGAAAAPQAANARDAQRRDASGAKRVVFELSHAELGALFDDVERIQAQLDALA